MTDSVRIAIGGLLLAIVCHVAAFDVASAPSAVLHRANSARVDAGRPALSTDAALKAAAGQFAAYMAKTGKFDHTADDRRPEARAKAAGYAYCIVAENIGHLYRSNDYPSVDDLADEFVKGWLASPGHRRNLLDAAVTQTGVGVARDSAGRYYAVQLFGLPRSAAIAFEIRNGSAVRVAYQVDGENFSLQPRAVRHHAVCGPAELRVVRTRGESSLLKAENNARYTVLDDRVVRTTGSAEAPVAGRER